MLLRLIHETVYDYTPPVKNAQHMAHLKPRASAWQQLLSHSLSVSPEPAQQSEAVDVFGNTRAFFSLQAEHDELRVVADSLVATTAPPAPAPGLPWEQVRERMRYHRGAAYDAATEFTFPSPYVPRHEDFVAYARPSFSADRPLLEAARDLMERIHNDFVYESQATEVNTPAVEALALRKGVCQDFAHIMVACLRGMGLPARYVSGYLLTEPPPGQPRLIGSDASHAWVSVWSPARDAGGAWCDLDPTNNRAPGEDYVTLAVGRDYSDVSPVRGVIHGGDGHTLKVAVTVHPVEDESQAKEPLA
ncbi:MAG: transglutaminase family protein [Ramlibacter sp.]|nr:transglutaminase family protein [Ramlibacter sp.]